MLRWWKNVSYFFILVPDKENFNLKLGGALLGFPLKNIRYEEMTRRKNQAGKAVMKESCCCYAQQLYYFFLLDLGTFVKRREEKNRQPNYVGNCRQRMPAKASSSQAVRQGNHIYFPRAVSIRLQLVLTSGKLSQAPKLWIWPGSDPMKY